MDVTGRRSHPVPRIKPHSSVQRGRLASPANHGGRQPARPGACSSRGGRHARSAAAAPVPCRRAAAPLRRPRLRRALLCTLAAALAQHPLGGGASCLLECLRRNTPPPLRRSSLRASRCTARAAPAAAPAGLWRCGTTRAWGRVTHTPRALLPHAAVSLCFACCAPCKHAARGAARCLAPLHPPREGVLTSPTGGPPPGVRPVPRVRVHPHLPHGAWVRAFGGPLPFVALLCRIRSYPRAARLHPPRTPPTCAYSAT